MSKSREITGIILVGGKSSRFGTPKYLAKIGDKSLLEIAIDKLLPFCDEIIVVSKDEIAALPEQVTRLSKIKYVKENDNRFHPLIGIGEGLKTSSNVFNIVMACDTPFISSNLISRLIETKKEISIFSCEGKPEPLFGFYSKSCLPKINNFLNSQHKTPNTKLNMRIIDFIKKCDCEIIELNENTNEFFNINTQEDLYEARRLIKSNPTLIG